VAAGFIVKTTTDAPRPTRSIEQCGCQPFRQFLRQSRLSHFRHCSGLRHDASRAV